MAEPATAVLEEGTAEEAPDTETLEESVDTAAETPDTEESPESPDTEETPEPSFEERLKEERTKWEAELRAEYQEQANAQAAQARRTQAQQLRTGQTANRLASIAKWAFDQGEQGHEFRFDPRSVNQLALEMEAAVFQDQSDAWSAAFNAYLGRNHNDFKPSRETARKLEVAFRDWNPGAAVDAQFTAISEAIRAELEPKLRKEITAEVRAKGTAAGKTQGLREADAARRASGRPTGGGDSGAVSNESLSDIIANPLISAAERAKAFERLYGIAPPGH